MHTAQRVNLQPRDSWLSLLEGFGNEKQSLNPFPYFCQTGVWQCVTPEYLITPKAHAGAFCVQPMQNELLLSSASCISVQNTVIISVKDSIILSLTKNLIVSSKFDLLLPKLNCGH